MVFNECPLFEVTTMHRNRALGGSAPREAVIASSSPPPSPVVSSPLCCSAPPNACVFAKLT